MDRTHPSSPRSRLWLGSIRGSQTTSLLYHHRLRKTVDWVGRFVSRHPRSRGHLHSRVSFKRMCLSRSGRVWARFLLRVSHFVSWLGCTTSFLRLLNGRDKGAEHLPRTTAPERLGVHASLWCSLHWSCFNSHPCLLSLLFLSSSSPQQVLGFFDSRERQTIVYFF